MSGESLVPRSAGAFIKLASVCGFSITAVDLVQLSRRKFIEPGRQGDDEVYVSLHLYALAQYFEAVRPVRHPWASVAPERTLDEVGQLGRRVGRIVESLASGRRPEAQGREEAMELLMEMERFINEIDPFGPLANIVDLMREDVVGRLRGSGRLYAEIRRAAKELAELIEGPAEEPGVEACPMTMEVADAEEGEIEDLRSTQLLAPIIDVPRSAPAPEVVPVDVVPVDVVPVDVVPVDVVPVDVVPVDVVPVDVVPVEQGAEEVEEGVADDGEFVEEEASFDLRATQVVRPVMEVQPALEEESSEPLVLLDEEVPSVTMVQFHRQSSEVTLRNEELARRLHQLREHDEAVATVRDPVKSDEEEPDNLVEKIAELNRLRETYLKDQAWQELADLYEHGIDLFTDPAERQQVCLVLGMLYETKLGRAGLGLEYFGKAFMLTGTAAGEQKAWDGLRRIGARAGGGDLFGTWLEGQLDQDLEGARRQMLQREYALMLHRRGEGQRAFVLFASMVLNGPELLVDPSLRADFDILVAVADMDAKGEFFKDLLEQEIGSEVREWALRRLGAEVGA